MKIQQREGRKEALKSCPLQLGRSYCPESEHIAQKHHYQRQVFTYCCSTLSHTLQMASASSPSLYDLPTREARIPLRWRCEGLCLFLQNCSIPFGCQLLLLLLLTLSSWSFSTLLLSDASLSRVAQGSLKLVQILEFTVIQEQQEYTVMPGFQIYLLSLDPKM